MKNYAVHSCPSRFAPRKALFSLSASSALVRRLFDLGLLRGFLLLAVWLGLIAQPLHALTYVSSSLTDTNATNGNGVSSPSGSQNIQYSDGSSSGSYGQIDIADDPADPDWVYDLGSTKSITSMTFWSYGFTTAWSQMPAGTITVYCSSSSTGPWTQIGTVTRDMTRDTTPPNSQATAGEGFRVPCDGTSGRYVRINVVTPSSTGGLDNHWVIRRVEENADLVIHSFYRTSDGSSAINDYPRIPYNAVDGNSSTMWNPLATDIKLNLDLGPTARRFQQITFTQTGGDGSYLPQRGEVRVSSSDNPDDMDTVVGVFDIAWTTESTDSAVITLPQPIEKRFVEIHWTKVRNSSWTETRIAEITVDTVSAKPAGVDITHSSIPSQYRPVANDGIDDVAKIQAAMDSGLYPSIYLPAGTYTLTGQGGATHPLRKLWIPAGQRLYGAGPTSTVFEISGDDTAMVIDAKDNVMLDHFGITRTGTNDATNAMLMVLNNTGTGAVCDNTQIDSIKLTSNRSRSASIVALYAVNLGITNCEIYDPQRQIQEMYAGTNTWFVYGAGIDALYCTNLYIYDCDIVETRDLLTSLSTPQAANGVIYQAGGIQIGSSARAIIWGNYIERFGNALDLGGSNFSWVANNEFTEVHDTGVKLVNGTVFATVTNNIIDRCGLNAIWLSPGNQNLTTRDNVITYNIITETGQGISAGHWNNSSFGLDWWAPAGIVVDKSDDPNTRTQYNLIQYNDFYSNGSMQTPTSTYSVWEHTGTYTPINNTINNNTVH